jgi:hypothetical protein
MTKTPQQEWLLIFYSVPSHPVSARMKIWRKLAKTGAVQLKGAVYILPASDEHEELCQWIIGEVKSLGGDGAFVRTARVETIPDPDVRALFNAQRDAEYRELDKVLDGLERKVQSSRKSAVAGTREAVAGPLAASKKTYEDIQGRDFFSSPLGRETGKRIRSLESTLSGLQEPDTAKAAPLARKDMKAYRRKVWVTRKRPFIDRMAAAWLIRRFVDPEAKFRFIDEKEREHLAAGEIAFDMQGGEFTHYGELCTFEVFVRSFGIKDRAVRKIAEVVHDLDLKDDKYGNAIGSGIEEVLTGIRKTVKDDAEMLEKGIAVFEMIYQSRI